jgi:hypothetical protein
MTTKMRFGAAGKLALVAGAAALSLGVHPARAADAELPVWPILMRDGRRYFLDAASFDAPAKGFLRWLREGLHRLDFVPIRRGPVWAGVTLALLSLVTFGAASGWAAAASATT